MILKRVGAKTKLFDFLVYGYSALWKMKKLRRNQIDNQREQKTIINLFTFPKADSPSPKNPKTFFCLQTLEDDLKVIYIQKEYFFYS